MANGKRGKLRLDFGNLPLVEAAVRVSFESPYPLKFHIINQIAESLHEQFPQLLEPTSFEVPPGLSPPPPPFSPGQIPGAVYSGNPNGLVITLQNQVIVARWLKKNGDLGDEYPRFQALRDALWRSIDALSNVCDGQLPRVVVVNMSYVNFLQISHAEAVVTRYFSDLAQIKATDDATQIHKIEVSWLDSGAIDLRYSLDQVTANYEEQDIEGFRLTTAAGRRLEKDEDPRQALDGIHDRLQVFFRDLISDRAVAEWQLKEVPLE